MNPKARIGARATTLALRYGTMGLSGRNEISQEQRERNMERIMRAARNDAARLKERQAYEKAEKKRLREAANITRVRAGLAPIAFSNG